MSGTFPTPISPLTPQGTLTAGSGNLLQANTTLLQPISGSFKLFDMLWLLMLTSGTASPAIAELSNETTAIEEIIEDQIALLQRQIDDLGARLTAAGIA